jgi:hypothetical protein
MSAVVPSMEDPVSKRLTPRSTAQTLAGYQENHQIEMFMQEMLSVVFAVLPEDPFEYMTYHIASHRPAPPPSNSTEVCGSGALWVLLPGGDPLFAEHWRLRRCWLTTEGVLCMSNATSQVTKSSDGLLIGPPNEVKPRCVPIRIGASYQVLEEEDAARPFAFRLVADATAAMSASNLLIVAAGSEEQLD